MKQPLVLFLFLLSISLHSQNDDMLLGKISKKDLMKAPYQSWFLQGYNSYIPEKEISEQLKKLDKKNYTITIFLGTWCSDTHREIPRFLKLMEDIGFPEDKIELIAVNTGDGVHKQSPNGEHKDKYIFKVPTIIVSANNRELNRIVEYPVESLERDLFLILKNEIESSDSGLKNKTNRLQTYSPNSRSYPTIIDWLEKGVLTEKNISIKGLAEQIRFKANSAGEINAAAFVLFCQNKLKEASALCKIGSYLYPDTANLYFCAIALAENGEKDEAIDMLRRYLARSKDIKDIDRTLELYNKIKQL